jgi:hypothetical protein
MSEKSCSKCNVIKDVTQFYRNTDSKDGLRSWCKSCCHQQTKKYRTEHPDIVKQQDTLHSRQYRARQMVENPKLCKARDMIYNARRRAREKNIEFSITLDNLPWQTQDYCRAFPWVKLIWNNPKWQDDSPSLDRIDNSRGYVPGNVEIISLRANKKKSDSTFEEIHALHEYVTTIREQSR